MIIESNTLSDDYEEEERNLEENHKHLKRRKKVKFKNEKEILIYNLRNEINELYIDLEQIKPESEDILIKYKKIISNLKEIILLKNTDSGSYYMAALCCDEVYQYLINNNEKNNNEEFKYLKLSHDFYNCFIRLVSENKEIIEILLTQTLTLLKDYKEFINKKEEISFKKEILKYFEILYKFNIKKSNISIKKFPKYLKQIRSNKYILMKLKYAEEYGMEKDIIIILIKMILFNITDICYDNLKLKDTIFNKSLINFNKNSCKYLEKLQLKFQNIEYNKIREELSEKYNKKFNEFNIVNKRIIISKQLKLLLKYLKRGIYFNTTYEPNIHELLSTCIIFIIYSFQIEKFSIVLKGVNLLNLKQNIYLKNFFKKEWYNLKLISLISYENMKYIINKSSNNFNYNNLKPNFPNDFIENDYNEISLSNLLILNDWYLKNEKYIKFIDFTNWLINKLTNISNIIIRKILFNLLRKKLMIFKRLNKSKNEQLKILLEALELFPFDNGINIQLSELYGEMGDINLEKYYMNQSNKQMTSSILTKLETNNNQIIEGELDELLIKLIEMFPKLQEIYNKNIKGEKEDYNIFNTYLMISRHMIRLIFRCKDFKKPNNKYLSEKKFLNISLNNWINIIDAHVIISICLFDLKNLNYFLKSINKKEIFIEGSKLIYDSLKILENSFESSYIRNWNKKFQGIKIILQVMKIISKYNIFLKEEDQINLFEMFLNHGKKLISICNDTSILYFIIRLIETIKFNKNYLCGKEPLDSLITSNFARHLLRILERKLCIKIINESKDTILLIEQYLVCCSIYNIYTYTFEKIDKIIINLEKIIKIPYNLSLIFSINCFNHSKSRKIINRDYTIKRGFDSLFKSLEYQLKDYKKLEEEINIFNIENNSNSNINNLEKLNLSKFEKLSIIYTIKYNIGRAYHNYNLIGIAEKYYWDCRFSPNIYCRTAGFINLSIIYEENSNKVLLDKLYKEYLIN